MKTGFVFAGIFAGIMFDAVGVVEPAKELPLVQEVDVVVIGGSSGAVSAACKAKASGASVFLLSPRPYLGEDIAGKMRLASEPDDDFRSPLKREMFTRRRAERLSLPFTYTANIASSKKHYDLKNHMLADGKYSDSSSQSVQFDGPVTITLDLGEVIKLKELVACIFARSDSRGFDTGKIAVKGSVDGKTWRQTGTGDVRTPIRNANEAYEVLIPAAGSFRYLQVYAPVGENVKRQLLGEFLVIPESRLTDVSEPADRTTPLLVKKALDAALLKAGIPFLTGALACGTVVDEKGQLSGVVMANRSGRQAIKAKVVIDATERGWVARRAGGEATPFLAGTYTFTRMLVAGEAPRAEGVRAKELFGLYPVRVQSSGNRRKDSPNVITGRLFECAIDLPMKDGSSRSFAAAEQKVRDLTYVASQLESADTMLLTPPDRIFGKKSSEEDWKGIDRVDLRALQPKGTEYLFVLSAMADLSRKAAQEMMRPGNLMVMGERVGAEAARMAAARGSIGAVHAAGNAGGKKESGAFVGEQNGTLPAYLSNAKGNIPAEADDLPVLATCDVVVAGAGTGGGPAGIAAGRHGAKTIVCEYIYQMGGVETDGLIGSYYWGNRVGFTSEIDAGVKEAGNVFSQAKSEWYRRENRQANVEIWYGTLVNGVVVENNAVTGIIVLTPAGERGVIRCKVAIDCTGNAVLPAFAGCETEFITADEVALQGVGMTPRNLGASYSNTDIGFVDDTDAADLCFFALRSRMSMGNSVWDQAQVVNSRERRRMIGAFYMTPMDVVNKRKYPDVVVQPFSNFDTHGETVHEQFFIEDPGHHGQSVNLPYRCFLPKTLDGLLVTGLGISAHRDAMPILRMQPDVQNQGYAAGTAAAMAIKAGVTVRKVDIRKLQKHLIEKKILTPDTLGMKDSFPLSNAEFQKATTTLPKNYAGLGVLMTDYGRAIPLLRKAFTSAKDSDAKFIYAHVLAMMRDPIGEDLLIQKVVSMSWDKGWNYRGMGQFNRSVSWLDSYIIALGRCRSRKAVPSILLRARELNSSCQYSHFRAVALALESIGDPSAAPALAEILGRPGIGGHAFQMGAKIPLVKNYANIEGDKERSACLRELAVARALYRLGDAGGKGRATLEQYAIDPRRAYANHCRLVLQK